MHRVRGTLAPVVLVTLLLGCAAEADEISVPVADVVVTAPLVTIELPPITEPVTTGQPSVALSETPPSTIGDTSATTPATPAPATSTTTATTNSSAPPTTNRPATTTAPASNTRPPTTPAPPTTAAPLSDGFYRIGDEGPEVGLMQFKLSVLDYLPTGSDNGVFDEATRLGLRRFQSDYGLGVDGVFGPATGRALNAAVRSVKVEG